jgi:mRNA-degrading endonuclease RelE of RelBE toxin-antitoxin system
VGDYRIIAVIHHHALIIEAIEIAHRREAYN